MALPLQERYVNLLTDFGFKRVFGSEPNKRLLVDFLNTLLPEHHHVQNLSYSSSEHQGKSELDRKAIFDIYCQGNQDERFIVEIQKAKQNYFKDRSVYYSSFPIQEQALKGEWNYRLDPVYSIGILDFVFDDHKQEATYIHEVELKNQHCQVFYDKLKYIYIELPKFNKALAELETHQDKWLYLLRHLPELEGPPSPFQDPVFLELFEIAEIANFTPAEQETYERSLKYYRDLNNVVDSSKEVGIEIGRQEGIEIGREEGIGIGREEGIGIGREEGIEIGTRSLLLRLLTQKLGDLPEDVLLKINRLSSNDLEILTDAIFSMQSMTALVEWLDSRE